MISVAEAKKIIEENIIPLAPVIASLQVAAGKVLAADIFSPFDIPAFPQSSMDGYAFSFKGWKQGLKLQIEGEIPAGHPSERILKPGKAIRIFTGGAVPPGADTVIIQEKASVENSELLLRDDLIKAGANVRPKGSEIRAGHLALQEGSLLTPAAIGFLAGIGVSEVDVFPNPRITVIVTGKELQRPGLALLYGQIYESNSLTLTTALQQLYITTVDVIWADDDLAILTNILNTALQKSDMVLLTGGISAGDYDFVLEAATTCGVSKLFHKIKQRPGRPLYFGMKESKAVFGLPGNPSSVLTCFYEYVVPALDQMSHQKKGLQSMQVPFAAPFQKIAGLTHFLKGYYDGKAVTPLNAQESYRLSSFAKANCLIVVNEEITACKEGEMTEIHLIPQ